MKVYLVMYRQDTDYNAHDSVDSVYLSKEKAEARLEEIQSTWGKKWWFSKAWISEEVVKE